MNDKICWECRVFHNQNHKCYSNNKNYNCKNKYEECSEDEEDEEDSRRRKNFKTRKNYENEQKQTWRKTNQESAAGDSRAVQHQHQPVLRKPRKVGRVCSNCGHISRKPESYEESSYMENKINSRNSRNWIKAEEDEKSEREKRRVYNPVPENNKNKASRADSRLYLKKEEIVANRKIQWEKFIKRNEMMDKMYLSTKLQVPPNRKFVFHQPPPPSPPLPLQHHYHQHQPIIKQKVNGRSSKDNYKKESLKNDRAKNFINEKFIEKKTIWVTEDERSSRTSSFSSDNKNTYRNEINIPVNQEKSARKSSRDSPENFQKITLEIRKNSNSSGSRKSSKNISSPAAENDYLKIKSEQGKRNSYVKEVSKKFSRDNQEPTSSKTAGTAGELSVTQFSFRESGEIELTKEEEVKLENPEIKRTSLNVNLFPFRKSGEIEVQDGPESIKTGESGENKRTSLNVTLFPFRKSGEIDVRQDGESGENSLKTSENNSKKASLTMFEFRKSGEIEFVEGEENAKNKYNFPIKMTSSKSSNDSFVTAKKSFSEVIITKKENSKVKIETITIEKEKEKNLEPEDPDPSKLDKRPFKPVGHLISLINKSKIDRDDHLKDKSGSSSSKSSSKAKVKEELAMELEGPVVAHKDITNDANEVRRFSEEYKRSGIPQEATTVTVGSTGSKIKVVNLNEKKSQSDTKIKSSSAAGQSKIQYASSEKNYKRISGDAGVLSKIILEKSGKKICHFCQAEIGEEEKFMQNNENSLFWHPYHFKCEKCQTLLLDLEHYFFDEKLYCPTHFAEIASLPLCRKCKKHIYDDKYTFAAGSTWHSGHFICSICQTPLVDTKYVVDGDKIYCFSCHLAEFNHNCSKCGKLILPNEKFVQSGGNFWHSNENCLKCSTCGKSLVGKSHIFLKNNGFAFCNRNCGRKFSIIN